MMGWHNNASDYIGHPLEYYRGGFDAAMHELSQIETSLGVSRIGIRSRLEQMGGLLATCEQLGIDTRDARGNDGQVAV